MGVPYVPFEKGISFTALLPRSATYIFPQASTAMPVGDEKPEPMVIGVPVPPGISFTSPPVDSPTKKFPLLSIAKPAGWLKPEYSVVFVAA